MAPSVRGVALLLVAHLYAGLSADAANNAALSEPLAASTSGSALYEDGRGLTPTDRRALEVMFAFNVAREFEPRDWGAFLVGVGNSARIDYSDIMAVHTESLLPGVSVIVVHFINKTLDEAQSLVELLGSLIKSGNMMAHLVYLRVPVAEVFIAYSQIIPYQVPEPWLQPCAMGKLKDVCNEYPCNCRTTARVIGATINGLLSCGPIAFPFLLGSCFLLYLLGPHEPFPRHTSS